MRYLRAHKRGYTLVELMVAMAIGFIIVAGALVFVAHNTRLLEFTKSELDRDRTGRLAMELLVEDLRVAGLGVGYDASGNFGGLMLGTYTVQGGGTFGLNQNVALGYGQNTSGLTGTYNLSTDDIGIRFANGGWRTIANYSGTGGQICRGSGFQVGDIVLMIADDNVAVRTVQLQTIGAAGSCTYGNCAAGCDDFTFVADSSYNSGGTALSSSYVGGEMAGAYKTVVWFVDTTGADPGSANLRRAEIGAASPCTARDQTCGQLAAYDVETVKLAINQWDPTTSAWVNQTSATALDRRRIRLDVEMVVRTRTSETRAQDPITLQLSSGACVPGPCGSQDRIARRVLRTSVEVRNAGRMNLRG
jgi:type IV pilus assembly protein PilW